MGNHCFGKEQQNVPTNRSGDNVPNEGIQYIDVRIDYSAAAHQNYNHGMHSQMMNMYPQNGRMMTPSISYNASASAPVLNPVLNANNSAVIMCQGQINPMPPNNLNRVTVRALYKYESHHNDDLPFEKDDFMIVQCDRSEPWWFAEHVRTKKTGYIPSNYVVIDDGLPSSLDSWYDISRREADRLLLLMGNPKGTYIIRPSSDPRNYALSVRHYDEKRNLYLVKHYKIRALDHNAGYFISQRRSFSTISDLIDYYTKYMDGLCCCLTKPCPRQYRPPVQFRDIEINRQSIKLYQKLGHGSFGEVRLGRWNDSVDVAVKLLKPNSMDRDKFICEAELMHKLHHKQIVQILGICKEPPDEPVYIVTELMEKGALLHFLQNEEGRAMSLSNLIDMMAQIAEGMAYLESKNFVHRDLRAANILVGLNLLVKVADFGLARVTQVEGDVYKAEDGTKFPIKWTAPEAALNRIFSVKSDVWSFGILMYEIITYGRTPYPSMSNRQVIDEVCQGYRMPRPEGPSIQCSHDLYGLMLNCWDAEPCRRPTFAYLKDIFDNWNVQESQYLEN